MKKLILNTYQIKLALAFLLINLCNKSITCIAQENILKDESFKIEDVISSMCLKNDRFNPSLYTGAISFKVPIYTYKDPDFELPIFIEYVSDGLKTNDPAGYLGLGWNLNAGGSITRIINGMPDEDSSQDGGFSFCKSIWNGYWYFHTNENKNDETYLLKTGKAVCRSNNTPLYNWTLQNGMNTETSFDIFSFNFRGHKGNFCMGPDTIYVFNTNQPHGEYKIEIVRNNTVSSFFPLLKFKIITGDGYKYTFERAEYLENGSALHKKPEFEAAGSLQRIANTYWPLVQIEAPNGRKVTFEYNSTEFSASSRPYQTTCVEWDEKPVLRSLNGYCYGYLNTIEHKFPIKTIKINDVSINFDYEARKKEHVAIDGTYDTIEIPTISRLKSIIIKASNSSAPVKTCTFEYNYSSTTPINPEFHSIGGRPVLFLKK